MDSKSSASWRVTVARSSEEEVPRSSKASYWTMSEGPIDYEAGFRGLEYAFYDELCQTHQP